MRRMIGIGAVVGMGWGIAMRAWMRFITTSPEFSWNGTLMIIMSTTLVGAILGFARHRRAVGGSGWWRISVVSLLLLGGAGSVMWPSVLLAGPVFARPWQRWTRALTAGAAAAIQFPVINDVILQNPNLSSASAVLAISWYLPMVTLEAWGFSVLFAPASEQAPAMGLLKRAAISIPFLAIVGFAALAMGVIGG